MTPSKTINRSTGGVSAPYSTVLPVSCAGGGQAGADPALPLRTRPPTKRRERRSVRQRVPLLPQKLRLIASQLVVGGICLMALDFRLPLIVLAATLAAHLLTARGQ